MQLGRQLEVLMAARQFTQAEVAEHAGVSQATVSRMLRRQPQRSGAAYLRLCGYIQQQAAGLPGVGGPPAAFEALRRVWDGSEGHAAALTELIDASQHLWPGLSSKEKRPSPAQSNSTSV